MVLLFIFSLSLSTAYVFCFSSVLVVVLFFSLPFYPQEVPVLSDGIYHIDSFILDAPKTAICVCLQDDFKYCYKPGYEHDYIYGHNHEHHPHYFAHDNVISLDMDDDEDFSSLTSFEENSVTTPSENKNSIDSIELHENCCSAYNISGNNYMINNENALGFDRQHENDNNDDADVADDVENLKHVFDNDEFIIVPHVPQKLITSHCNIHSGLMILAQPDNELITTPITTSDSCNSSPAPSSGTANTTTTTNSSFSADSNYISTAVGTNNLAAAAASTSTSTFTNATAINSSCFRDDMPLHYQCLMQKCAH